MVITAGTVSSVAAGLNINPISILGDLFGNDFNLSCINSTEHLQPKNVPGIIQTIVMPKLQQYISGANSGTSLSSFQQNLNKLSERASFIHAYFSVRKASKSTWSSCSKKGFDMYISWAENLKNQVESLAQSSEYTILSTDTKSGNIAGQLTPHENNVTTSYTGPYSWKEWHFSGAGNTDGYLSDYSAGTGTQSIAGGFILVAVALGLLFQKQLSRIFKF